MGRILNKIVRLVINKFSGGLSQELNGGNSDGVCVIPDFPALIRRTAAEGCVLLKNDGTLPLKDKKVAVFGRVQYDYFYVGYGSGGDVVTPYRISFADGIKNCGINADVLLAETYRKWIEKPKNSADEGFWGHWPYSFPEMPLEEKLVAECAERNDVALVIIGRAAGEDRENKLKKGSFYLTDKEKDMLDIVTEKFQKTVVVLNIGNVMDMSWTEEYGDKIAATLIAWQGGMESGNALCDILKGSVCPCGKLTDTIARNYEDYPSSNNFGNKKYNKYVEDIFVGYRYFETFAKEKVLYPFGYGLSYTDFSQTCKACSYDGKSFNFQFIVKNIGSCSGSYVLQLYCQLPQGSLGKPARVLAGFEKTPDLKCGEEVEISVSVPVDYITSYDDVGKSGYKSCFVLEKGDYVFYYGSDCRCEKIAGRFTFEQTIVIERANEVMSVPRGYSFARMTALENNRGLCKDYEATPLRKTHLRDIVLADLPKEIPFTGNKGYKLKDVKSGKISIEEFIAQLSDKELEALTRGEGAMNSPLGVKGNAGALGGTIESLWEKGVPAVITTDGPAGIRIRHTCALIPCGTALACTWNKKLIEELFALIGEEMNYYGSDVILSPGMNIHRNPLCGRNFEYYSEDPILSGIIAKHAILGVQKKGVSACPKHFACNNQETNRQRNDSVVSERALREIYLKGFEIVVKEAKPDTIMTSYNKINGVWSHYNYELCTTVLRKEWGFKGMVMTDWWMQYAHSPEFPAIESNAYRIRAQVDVLMPGVKRKNVGKKDKDDGTLFKTIGREGGITLGEIQRSAKNVLEFVMNSSAMKRENL